MIGLILAALLFTQPARQPATGAVVIADYDKGVWDSYECPADEICMRYPYRTTFRIRDRVAGVTGPSRFEGTIWMHGEMIRRRLALLVERRAGGWHVVDWSLPGEPCFSTAQVERLGLARSGEATEQDQTCFPAAR